MRALLFSALIFAGCEDEDLMLGDAGDASLDTGTEDSGADAGQMDAEPEDVGMEDTGSAIPSMLRVSGEAMRIAPDGERADCSFFADVGDLIFLPNGSWSGLIFGGEVFRTITTSTAGNRFEFTALIGGPASSDRDDDRVEVRIAGDQPPNATPFWLALEVLTGTVTADYEADGSWTCAPLNLNEPGFVDLNVYAPGQWRVRPNP